MIPKTINDDSSQNNKDEFFPDLKKDITTSVLVEFAFKEVNKSMEGLDDETKVKQKLTEELDTKISELKKKIDIEKRAKNHFYIKEQLPYKTILVVASFIFFVGVISLIGPIIGPIISGPAPTATPTTTPTPTVTHQPGQTSFINQSSGTDTGKEKEVTLRQTSFINSIGMAFVLIPAGEFDMGSPEGEKDRDNNEGPIRHITFKKAFNMSRYEVTQKQWREVMGKDNNPSVFEGDYLPVENISWNEVQEFIKKLNNGTSKYRLPSEAEWEYAARAGNATIYSFGNEEHKLGNYAWYNVNSYGKTHQVGDRRINPNPWGLYDMHGNVYEWVMDEGHDNYDDAPQDGSAWYGKGYGRVIRGCSFLSKAAQCRSASRIITNINYKANHIGFRLVSD